MPDNRSSAKLKKLPEFKALGTVYKAMKPLDPERRRKVVEALHALLEISAGKKPAHGLQGPGEDRPKRKPKTRA